MALRQLSGLDSVFVSAETPTNPLHVMGLILLDPSSMPGGYDFERFREFFASRLQRVPPLRRRLVEVPFGLGRPYWIEDPDMDLDDHLRRAALPSPGTSKQLAQMAAEMNEALLPRDRPLWQMRAVEGLEDGHVAVLAKIHHAMMDGMAGMKFMTSLFSRTPEPQPIASEPVRTRRQSEPEPLELVGHALWDLTTRPWRIAKASATTLVQTARRQRPSGTRHESLEVPRSVLNGSAGPRRVAYLSVSLRSARDVAASADAKVNDVVLALVGGALRKVLEADGTLPDEPLIAGVPVSIHEKGDDLANAYSAIFASLHTDEPDPVTRLLRIRDGSKAAKAQRAAGGGSPLDAWADIPLPLEISLISRAYTGLKLVERLPLVSNCVVSNVAGPKQALHLAGARVVGIHPLGPVVDGMTLNVTVIGREDALDFGIVAGASAPSDLWAFARAIPEELEALAKGEVARSSAGGPQHPREQRPPAS